MRARRWAGLVGGRRRRKERGGGGGGRFRKESREPDAERVTLRKGNYKKNVKKGPPGVKVSL